MLNCRKAGSDLLSALTAFASTVLAGLCPKEVAPFFFGGRLITLDKKIRSRSSDCFEAYDLQVRKQSWNFPPVVIFFLRQLGVGISGGCEAVIHSALRYLETLPPDHVLVKLDFSNAFNSLHRLDMLNAIHDRLPDLYPYCSLYRHILSLRTSFMAPSV